MKRRKFLGSSVAAFAATVALLQFQGRTAYSKQSVNHEVQITNLKFSPDTLEVSTGDRVTWTNDDIVPHTATAKDGSWTTGRIGANESAEILVGEDFETSYFCEFHPSMTASLNLT